MDTIICIRGISEYMEGEYIGRLRRRIIRI